MEATGGDAVAAEAERLLKHAHHTHYQHDPVVDAKAGRYDVDCAAFVGVVLEAAAPQHFEHVPKAGEERYPRAFEIFEFLHADPAPHGWQRVARLEDAKRGDVIAWRTAKVAPGRDTGHVLVVAHPPVFHASLHAWTVHVYDASNVAHYDDSREREGKFHSGVGEGTIRFKVDASGAPSAFQLGPHAEFHALHIVVARLEEMKSAKKKTAHAKESGPPAAVAQPPAPHSSAHSSGGHRIARAPSANEVLGEGEFAFTTYTLAAGAGLLLVPTSVACWGPGQTIPATIGSGSSTYTLAGGVVFRNS
jgi:hypothetical protein